MVKADAKKIMHRFMFFLQTDGSNIFVVKIDCEPKVKAYELRSKTSKELLKDQNRYNVSFTIAAHAMNGMSDHFG